MAIKEFPTLRVDDFRQTPRGPLPELCFLSHMHEDHTAGLSRKSYYGPVVYCTAATRALLLNFRTNSGSGELKYNHLRREICGKEIVKPLDMDKPYEFELRDGNAIQVTLIDANHCPGAAMVLIQPRSGTGPAVLYTGDVRCEKWHLDALSHNPNLLPYLTSAGGSKFLSLYVDDTFAAHVDPYKSYTENHTGIQELAKLLKTYPEEVHFCLTDRVTGHEKVLIILAQQLDTLVHMDAYYYNLYNFAADTSPVAKKLLEYCTLSLDEDSCGNKRFVRLHFCQKNMACPMREPHAPMAYIKPCNQPLKNVLDLQNAQHSSAMVPYGIMAPFEEDDRVFKGPDQRYYLDPKTRRFYPLFPWFYFSRHASFPEICRLRNMFKTCSVRSLAGETLSCLEPTLEVAPSKSELVSRLMENREMQERLIKRPMRASSVAAGLVRSNEALPVMAKKPKILPFYDRLVQQERRERVQKKSRNPSSHIQDSLTDSEDEDDRHNAMMLLCKQNAQEPGCEAQQPISAPNGRIQESPTNENIHFEKEELCQAKCGTEDANTSDTTQTPVDDSSTLPSPPASPEDTQPVKISNSEANMEQRKYVDETIDDEKQVAFNLLVERLREDPSYWFDIKLECLNSSLE